MVGRVVALALLSLFLNFESAEAGHQAVPGSKLALKDAHPGGDAAGRQWSVQAKQAESDATVVGDPTTHGATVSVFTEGTTSGGQAYALP